MDARYKTPRFWVGQALAALVAAAVLLVAFWVIDINALNLDDLIAVLCGCALMAIGLLMAVATLLPKTPTKRSHQVLGALTMVACGVALLIPPLAPASLDPRLVFGLFVAVLALSYGTNWALQKGIDEMQRRMTVDASVAGYYVFATGMMLHGAAQTLGLDVGISLWALIALLTVAQLFISSFVGWRRQAPLPKE